MTRAALALLVLLLLPAAAAQNAEVRLEGADGVWNGVSATDAPPGGGPVLVWVPPDARLQQVQSIDANGSASAASWRAAGANALQVDAPPDAARVAVHFDAPAPAFGALTFVAPAALDALRVEVAPPPGQVPQSGALRFEQGDDGAWRAQTGPLAPGDALALRVVDADRVGELPVLASVGALALLVLALGLLWHRVRPPLQGREAQRFLDHLAELQARLVPPIVAFALLNVFYFIAGLRRVDAGRVPLVAPTFGVDGSLAARAFEAFAERLVPTGVQLVVLRPVDAVLAQVQMTLFLAFVTTLPLLLYELARFIGPALMPRERRATMRVLPLVFGLFLTGASLGLLVMAPLMIRTLYGYAPNLGAAPLLAVGDLVSFTLVILVALGLAFELPVVMYVLSRLGLVRAATFRKYFRHSVVVIFLVAGIITPDPSVVSQMLVALPVTLLYLAGMFTATLGEGRRDAATSARPAGDAA